MRNQLLLLTVYLAPRASPDVPSLLQRELQRGADCPLSLPGCLWLCRLHHAPLQSLLFQCEDLIIPPVIFWRISALLPFSEPFPVPIHPVFVMRETFLDFSPLTKDDQGNGSVPYVFFPPTYTEQSQLVPYCWKHTICTLYLNVVC